MSDEQEPHRECWHIKNTKARAITIIRHFGIAGASRGADDLRYDHSPVRQVLRHVRSSAAKGRGRRVSAHEPIAFNRATLEEHAIPIDSIKCDPALEGALDVNGKLVVHPYEFWAQFEQVEISAFCVRNGIYCVPTQELVSWLSEQIAGRKAIEIGAGNGVLASHLGIPATDNRMQEWSHVAARYEEIKQAVVKYGEHVKPMDAEKAVRAFKPKVVISAWVTHKYFETAHERGGNIHGVREENIIANAQYISICNRHVHRHKPALDIPHEEFEFPWLVSRAFGDAANFIAVWKKGARRQ